MEVISRPEHTDNTAYTEDGYLRLEQPPLRCPKCHKVIPNNEDYRDNETGAIKDAKDRLGKHSGLVACKECALAAGGEIRKPKPVAKGRELEKLGQQTVRDIMGKMPMLEIK